jgi:hypothetical protein
MLASTDPNLFNGYMDTQDSFPAPIPARAPIGTRRIRTPARPSQSDPIADWNPDSGLVDRMLAYRDWWNLPVRRQHAPDRQPR